MAGGEDVDDAVSVGDGDGSFVEVDADGSPPAADGVGDRVGVSTLVGVIVGVPSGSDSVGDSSPSSMLNS